MPPLGSIPSPVYSAIRSRTRLLFEDVLAPHAYYEQPIALRHPIVFYEGHLPAFAVNTLVEWALGRPGIDDELEQLFERGIDPEDEARAPARLAWPVRQRVQEFARQGRSSSTS